MSKKVTPKDQDNVIYEIFRHGVYYCTTTGYSNARDAVTEVVRCYNRRGHAVNIATQEIVIDESPQVSLRQREEQEDYDYSN